MVNMTAAMKAFSWDPALKHAPKSPDVDDRGGFSSACRCGYAGKSVKSSPSHAYQATRVHAETENRRDQGKTVSDVDLPHLISLDPAAPGGAQGSSRPRTVSRSRSQGAPGTPCGCGCGEPSGGLFRPGHDSKLLSRLQAEVKSGVKTIADALAEMTSIGTSDKLKAKFESRVA